MRGVVYLIAAVAAAGIMLGIAYYPMPEEAGTTTTDTDSAPVTLMSAAGSMTIAVPEMHCEVACFPRVKETLQAADGVQSVELAVQQSEGVLDNRQVIVNYEQGFNPSSALAALVEEGFPGSTVVE